MRRVGGLWPQVISLDNILEAFLKARRGKRTREDVANFSLEQDREILSLREELVNRAYVPGAYRQFEIYEGKARLISAAPFRDRVVHHALMRVVEPIFERRFYHHSYACRPGKGVHKAVDVYEAWARRYAYVLKMDVRQFFPSLDRMLLMEEIYRYIKDEGVLWLFGRIIAHAPQTQGPAPLFPGDDLLTTLNRQRGLPIGNLTSQILANLYLNRLDHWIAANHAGGYLRYVDDLLVLGDNKEELWALRDSVAQWLTRMRLQLHPRKQHIMRTDRKVDVLGYQVSRRRRWVRGENVHRAGRRLRALARGYAKGSLDREAVIQSMSAWRGHVEHVGSLGLYRKLRHGIVFARARALT